MNAPVDVSGLYLETPRLILRPWQMADLEDFYAYASVDGVGQMAGWKPHESRAESQAVLSAFIAGNRTLALELKENRQVIGSLGLEPVQQLGPELGGLKGRELGYVLAKAHWGKGLMPEGAEAVIRHCFSVLGFDFLTLEYFLWNRQSARVCEKLGFRFYRRTQAETQLGATEQCNLHIRFHPKYDEVTNV